MVQDVADEHPAIQLWRASRRHTPAVHCHHHWLPCTTLNRGAPEEPLKVVALWVRKGPVE